jgi:hypothetical protein
MSDKRLVTFRSCASRLLMKGLDLVGRDDHRRLGLDDGTIVCRIQRDEFLDRHFGQPGCQFDVDIGGAS